MELEFDPLGKRLFGKSFSAAPARTAVIREKREEEIQARLFDEPVEEKTISDVPHRLPDRHDAEQPRRIDRTTAAAIGRLL